MEGARRRRASLERNFDYFYEENQHLLQVSSRTAVVRLFLYIRATAFGGAAHCSIFN